MRHRFEHCRFLTMVETFGADTVMLVNAAGRVTNVVGALGLSTLIPSKFDVRGARVYLAEWPTYNVIDILRINGIKEIYFAAEVDSSWQDHGVHIHGVNYEDDLNNLGAKV